MNAWTLALACSCGVIAMLVTSASSGEDVVLDPIRDATLIEHPDGARANGSGPAFFVGRTGQSRDSRRRAVIAFDVAEALPERAIVTRVRLWLHLAPSNEAPIDIGLHRVLSSWGEGASSASGGGGAPSGPGDVTWIHAFYPDLLWQTPGGDFAASPSATTAISEPGWYVWGSSPGMLADVQDWLEQPASEHGWILVGGEADASTSRRFDSRESESLDLRPHLEIEFVLPCEVTALDLPARALCEAYCEVLDCEGLPSASERACEAIASRYAWISSGSAPVCAPPE